jgi:hypothetical protein
MASSAQNQDVNQNVVRRSVREKWLTRQRSTPVLDWDSLSPPGHGADRSIRQKRVRCWEKGEKIALEWAGIS